MLRAAATAGILVTLAFTAACARSVPEICNTTPPYDSARYEHWQAEAKKAGCENVGTNVRDPDQIQAGGREATGNCPLPNGWVLAITLKPSPVPYTPKPVFFAQEIRPGIWSWQGSTVTYEQLLKQLATASELSPQPLFLFDFADGQTCQQLNADREGIAAAIGCSTDGVPCIEGIPDQLS